MLDHRHLLPAAVAAACLLVASGASADTVNTFTADATPAHVKPSISSVYTVVLTNEAASPEGSDRAKIGIPPGFVVDIPTVQASTSAAGACQASAWIPDGELLADAKLNLRQPGASPSDELCAGATLTVAFTATSPQTEGTFTWTSELLRGAVAFALGGAQPTVRVDGTAPAVSITQKPASPSNQGSATFEFGADEPATLECKVDAEAFSPCSSPKIYVGLADGSHTFVVKGIDQAGNAGQSSHTWTVDTAAPTVAITDKPLEVSNDNSPTFEFTTNQPANAECNLDGTGFASCSSPRTYTGLADGPHTLAVRATDAAGNTGAAATYSWTIDTVAPAATITGKPSDPSNESSPSFAFTAGEPSQFQCKLDAAAFTSCGSPQNYSGLGDGLHTFVVRATDAAGNVGPEASHGWTVDTVAPTTTITQKPANPSNDSSPRFAFTAGEPAQFQCKLDAAAFAPCASPQTYNGLAAGPHTISVRARDAAGNTGAAATYGWTIDTTAPSTEITVKPPDPSNDSSPSFSFTASEAGSSFACKLDNGAVEACTSPWTYTAVAAGSHTFSVRARDAASNTGAAEAYTWTIDTTAPTPTITQKPSNPSNDPSPSFAFTAGEPAQFQCKLDTAAFAPCVSAKSYTGLADGSHTFSVRASDSAGNRGVETSYTWVVDTVPPTATITGKPSDPSNVSSPSFSFTASQVGSSFLCKLDGGAFAPCTSPANYPGLADGSHTVVVKATDPAGNPSAEESHTWTIDTVSPTAAITGQPSNPNNSTSPSFSFTANETGSTFLCRLDGPAFAPCVSPKAHAALTPGAHTFAVKATDKAGNTGPEAAYTWTIDTAAPTAEITQKPAALSNDNSPTLSFTASQAGSTFACRLDGAAFATCVSPKEYTGVSDGAHTFVVKATDPAGNTSAETSYTWTVDTAAPATSLTVKPIDPSSDTTPTFSFSAGEAGSTFACKVDTGAFASCVSPTTLATLAPGTHTFSVRATDPAGNTGPEVSHTWTIDTTAPTTTIGGKPADPSGSGSASFSFTASETGILFSCRLDGGAFVTCATPLSYSGLGDGSHTFAVRATDRAGNLGAATSYTWTIDTTAPTTSINAKPNDPSNEASGSFSFSANETGSTFACRLDGAAFAACVSPKSFSNLGEGVHTFAVRATDPLGNTGQAASFSWRVDTVAPTASIVERPKDPSNETSPSFVLASSEGGSSFACRLEQGGFAPCVSPKSYGVLTDGRHDFAVRATDAAGNQGVAATYTWTIDTVGPTTAFTAKPGNPSNSTSPSFSFTSNEDATFVCLLDGSATPCTPPVGYSGLQDGPHAFSVRATDAAGNTGAETIHSWTIETRPPTAALMSGPPGLSNSSAASFAFAADEPSGFDCKVDDRGFEPCNSPMTYHGLADGGHAFLVRASDAVGNLSAPVAHAWTVDTAAPETTLVSTPAAGTATSATFAFSASESGSFECRLDGGPFALCASPKQYTGLSRASHQFEVRAVDAVGNTDLTPSLHAWRIEAPVVRLASALVTPKAGAKVTRPPLLVWRRVTRARYYNVQLYRGRRKVLSAWPTRTRLQLRARWKNLGRKEQLLPGSYRWYVWPGYGAPSARRYGQVLGQSTFVVARRSGR